MHYSLSLHLHSWFFLPSTKVAVNGHSYLHFRFFLYMCILPRVYTYIHDFFCLQEGWPLTATLICISVFLYMHILPQVYTIFVNFFLSIRVVVNGHSYLHFGFFCICASILLSTSIFSIFFFFNLLKFHIPSSCILPLWYLFCICHILYLILVCICDFFHMYIFVLICSCLSYGWFVCMKVIPIYRD